MAQVESSYDEFTKRNAAVVVIAAQKIEGLFRGREHVERKKYPFPVLFDETRKVTRAYGVYHALGTDAYNIAHPATFVIGPAGNVRRGARRQNMLDCREPQSTGTAADQRSSFRYRSLR